MAFIRFIPPSADKASTKPTIKTHTTDQKEIPVFVIPGIIGNGNELDHFLTALHQERGPNSIIWYYQEPANQETCSKNLPLRKHATEIALEILAKTSESPLPKIIMGFSFGGDLIAEVGSALEDMHFITDITVLDAPARSAIRKFVDSTHKDTATRLTENLRRVASYACTLALGSEEHKDQLTFLLKYIDSATVRTWLKKEERVTSFFNELLKQIEVITNNEAKHQCIRNVLTAKRNMLNLISLDTHMKNGVSRIRLIMTDETAKLYGAAQENLRSYTGEWEKYCRNITRINSPNGQLEKSSHMNLLNKENAPIAAKLIANSLESTLTSDFLSDCQATEIFGHLDPQHKSFLLAFSHLCPSELSLFVTMLSEISETSTKLQSYSGRLTDNIFHLFSSHQSRTSQVTADPAIIDNDNQTKISIANQGLTPTAPLIRIY